MTLGNTFQTFNFSFEFLKLFNNIWIIRIPVHSYIPFIFAFKVINLFIFANNQWKLDDCIAIGWNVTILHHAAVALSTLSSGIWKLVANIPWQLLTLLEPGDFKQRYVIETVDFHMKLSRIRYQCPLTMEWHWNWLGTYIMKLSHCYTVQKYLWLNSSRNNYSRPSQKYDFSDLIYKSLTKLENI